MVIRHCGFTAVVKVLAEVNWVGRPVPQDIEIEDQPEGGANALNVNRSVHVFWTYYLYHADLFFLGGAGECLSLCSNKPQSTNTDMFSL